MTKNSILSLAGPLHRAVIYLLALILLCPAARSQDISRDTYNGEAEITTPHGSISLLPGFIVPYGSSTKIYIGGAGVSLTISALADQTVTVGQQVTISATASGGVLPYGYGLYRNGALVSNTSTYTFTASLADNNSTYYVRCTDALNNSVQSNTATVTVTSTPIPLTISNPTNQSVMAGGYANFSVLTSGGVDPKTVVWKRNGSNVGTGLSYTYGPAVLADNAQTVSATVTDAANNTATSGTAVLNVTDTVAGGQQIIAFTYNLPTQMATSAAVYRVDDATGRKYKVRTLWANVTKPAGTYDSTWDGRLDDMSQAPDGHYRIKLIKHNVRWDWLGTYFNNSLDSSGWNKMHGTQAATIAFLGSKFYLSTSYQEGNYPTFIGDTTVINRCYPVNQKIDQTTVYSCSDGNRVYVWGIDTQIGGNGINNHAYVYALNPDGTEVDFGSNGVIQYGNQGSVKHASTINNMEIQFGNVFGGGVQVNGNILFSVRSSGIVYKLDKTSGAVIDSFNVNTYIPSYTGLLKPTANCVDINGNLWLTVFTSTNSKPIIQQLKFDGSGNYLGLGTTITDPTFAFSISTSPDGNKIAIIDADKASQQVKFYSATTGALLSTFGQPGGYYGTTIVSPDRFAFVSDGLYPLGYSFIQYAPNGTLYVNEFALNRTQHFSANMDYLGKIEYQPFTYNQNIDLNNPAKLYTNWMEANVDYSTDKNAGQHYQVTRWFGTHIPADINSFAGQGRTATLSNGRTYTSYIQSDGRHIIELTDTGIRNTNAVLNGSAITQMDKNGDWYGWNDNSAGLHINYKTPLLGFDANNNPIYGSSTVIATLNYNPAINNPLSVSSDPGAFLPDGSILEFNPSGVSAGPGYHVGLHRRDETSYYAEEARGTLGNYQGDYPTDGWFDFGNGTNYPGGDAHVCDSFIVWNHHGEFWKQSQTNEWQMLDQDLLNIGVWGTTHLKAAYECYPEDAGNGFASSFFKDQYGNYRVLHNDESRHGGVHSWIIRNLSSIRYDSFEVNKQGMTYVPPAECTSLLLNVPFNSSLDNSNGWYHTPYPADGSFYSRTNAFVYNPFLPSDVYMFFGANNIADTVSRVIPGSNVDWSFSGTFNYKNATYNGLFNPSSYMRMALYDNQGKLIAKIEYANRDYGQYGHPAQLLVNGQLIYQDDDPFTNGVIGNKFNQFDLRTDGAGLTFSCLGNTVTGIPLADPTASKLNPAKFSVEFNGGGDRAYAQDLILEDLNFCNHPVYYSLLKR